MTVANAGRPPALEMRSVSRVYGAGDAAASALVDFSLVVERGELGTCFRTSTC